MDLNHRFDLLYIHGRDAHHFLQGQLTCQLDDLSKQQAHLGAHCSPKGRVLSLFVVIPFQEGYLLHLPPDMAALCTQHLKPYVLRSQVHFDTPDDLTAWAMQCRAPQPTHPLLGTLPTDAWAHHQQDDYHITCLVPAPHPLYLIHAPTSEYGAWTASDQTGLHHCDDASWQRALAQAGIPSIVPATSGLFTPHMLNLHTHHAISFDKGCFCGQEIIARTHHLGHNKKHLMHWQGPHTAAQPGDALFDAQQHPVGKLVVNVPDAAAADYLGVLNAQSSTAALWLDAAQTIVVRQALA